MVGNHILAAFDVGVGSLCIDFDGGKRLATRWEFSADLE